MILAQNLHELDYHEQKEVNGGGVITVIVVTAVVTLVGNEVSKGQLERI